MTIFRRWHMRDLGFCVLVGLWRLPVKQGGDLLALVEHGALCAARWSRWSGCYASHVAEHENIARLVDKLQISHRERDTERLGLYWCAGVEKCSRGLLHPRISAHRQERIVAMHLPGPVQGCCVPVTVQGSGAVLPAASPGYRLHVLPSTRPGHAP